MYVGRETEEEEITVYFLSLIAVIYSKTDSDEMSWEAVDICQHYCVFSLKPGEKQTKWVW